MKQDSDTPRLYKTMRRCVLLQGLLSLLAATAALGAWIYFCSLLDTTTSLFRFGGAAMILGGWYFGHIRQLERQVVCPSCRRSLAGSDGWAVFERQCPHCHVSFRGAG